MRLKPARPVVIALLAGALSGCFALFSLDGYGPAGDIVGDGSTGDAEPKNDAFETFDASMDVLITGHVIFVTSQTFTGDLGGTTGADSHCRDIATDAAIPGSYVAFLGDTTHRAIDRVDLDAGPLRLSNGQLIANDVRELLTTGPRTVIDRDERGGQHVSGNCTTGPTVWTGTYADGGTINNLQLDCKSWASNGLGPTGFAGLVAGTGTTWAEGCAPVCSNTSALYCIAR